jgi:hypothetical protein
MLHEQEVEILQPYLTERMGLDLGELVLHVVGVHCADLVARGCAEDFDDLHELIDTRLTREKWLAKHKLSHDTAGGPDIWYHMSAN